MSTTTAMGDTQENMPPPQTGARFFPIVPSAHMRPIVRSPYGVNRAAQPLPRAVRAGEPSIAPSKNLANHAEMTDDAARKLLSIYSER